VTKPIARRFAYRLFSLIFVLALITTWGSFELHAARSRTATKLAEAAHVVSNAVQSLLDRFTAVAAHFNANDTTAANQVAVAVRMLRLDGSLRPAENLFLYDRHGRFIAATLPFSPEDSNASADGWFRDAALHPQRVIFSPVANAPLGEGSGIVISHALLDARGAFAGAIGTFLAKRAFRALLSPPALPDGTAVRLTRASRDLPLVAFAVGDAKPHPFLDQILTWAGEQPIVFARTQLPDGAVWQAEADAFASAGPGARRTALLQAALIATGSCLLLWLASRRRYTALVAHGRLAPTIENPGIRTPTLEIDWVWEIDARGRLVGVAGNAPPPLAAAVGKNFLDLLADDARAKHLRDAIAEREPVRDLELAFVLPGNPASRPRRFRLTGRAVTDTGGFWGTAGEVRGDEAAEKTAA
jgi:hypothetical protein